MALYEAAFDNRCVNILYRLSWFLIYPCYWSLNRLISCCVSTTDEVANRDEDPCYERFVYLVILIPTYLVIFMIFTPTALLGFCAWIIMQRYRHPYIYSYFESHHILEDWTNVSSKRSFRIGTANLGLLPEAIARINNLECTDWRAKEIGHRLANSQLRPKPKIFVESPSDNEIVRNSSSFTNMQNHYQYSEVVLANTETQIMKGFTNGIQSPENEDMQVPAGVYSNHVTGQNCASPANGRACNIVGCNGDAIGKSQTYDSIYSDTSQECAYVQESLNMRTSQSASSVKEGIVHNGSRSTTHSEYPGSESAPVDSNPSISLHACGLSLSEEPSYGDFSPTIIKEDSRTFNEALTNFNHSIEINFPPQIDFMCFEEVYEPHAAKTLIKKIHPWFSHIIYDVGINSWDSNLFMFNSGLVIASRYPILDADFKFFQESAREDKLICKGLLMAKVHLGNTRDKEKIVGYIGVTQLQSGRDRSFIRLNQLNKITKWLHDFKAKTRSTTLPHDIIAFDVLCGDFNFDNMSPGDMSNWSHQVLSQYSDPCRMTAGLDQTWTVGTELNEEMLYEDEVATPEGLQRILEDQNSRGMFVEDIEPYSFSENSIPSATGDFQRYKGNGRRRTDFLMYSNKTTHCKQTCEEYYFISQFATLTDHIPVVMTCSCIEQDFPSSNDTSQQAAMVTACPEDIVVHRICDDNGNIEEHHISADDNEEDIHITYESTV
ncbi:sphingomyelin phosphodiesterase 3-like [Ptychodera flava]|uniref:sphingomyelin phosphodiesterase 3-like n=1 Tax=Ptychodera flava TaxID=63121 RepID=UPI003969F804